MMPLFNQSDEKEIFATFFRYIDREILIKDNIRT